MNEEPLKENLCKINFQCPCLAEIEGQEPSKCLYFVPNEEFPEYCKFDRSRSGICESTVAAVNSMVILLKKIGIVV